MKEVWHALTPALSQRERVRVRAIGTV